MKQAKPLPSKLYSNRLNWGWLHFVFAIKSLFDGGYAHGSWQKSEDGRVTWTEPYKRPKFFSWLRRLEVGLVNLLHGACPFVDIYEGEPFYFSYLRYRRNWARETFWFLTPNRGSLSALPKA